MHSSGGEGGKRRRRGRGGTSARREKGWRGSQEVAGRGLTGGGRGGFPRVQP